MKRIAITDPPIVLKSLEDLGALSEQSGLFEIKPFKDWKGTSWCDKIFTMRLCNAGELVDVTAYCNEFPESARTSVMKVELLIRSVWAVDGRALISPEDLQKFNAASSTNLSDQEYLRNWALNLEQVVVDRLNVIYGGLQMKQVRRLQGFHLCDVCGKTYTNIGDDFEVLQYSLAEVICPSCLSGTDLKDYDLVKKAADEKVPKVDDNQSSVGASSEGVTTSSFGHSSYACECGAELNSIEEFTIHRETCEKASHI